jgi:two-component system nitrate/nitrite response regulator NarL
VKLLLVDDHSLFREGMKFLLRGLAEDLIIDEGQDCESAIVHATATASDLVLLDLKMPGLDGLAALTCVRESCPETPLS